MNKTKPFAAPITAAVLAVALAGCGNAGDIEGELTDRATRALSDAGLDGADVSFDGRDATVESGDAQEASEAGAVVAGVEGVEDVTAMGPDGEVEVASANDDDATDDATDDDAAGDDATDDGDSGEAMDDTDDSADDNGDGDGDDNADDNGGDDRDDADSGDAAAGDTDAAQDALDKVGRITFVKGSAKLTPSGEQAVRQAADALEQHSGVTVTIEGHTDASGASSFNKKLSLRRANAVLDRLKDLGVDTSRLTAEGLGESDPEVDDATTASQQAENRRVEFDVAD